MRPIDHAPTDSKSLAYNSVIHREMICKRPDLRLCWEQEKQIKNHATNLRWVVDSTFTACKPAVHHRYVER